MLLIVQGGFLYAESSRYWLYFEDKPENNYHQPSDKAMERRAIRAEIDDLTNYDIEPSQNYIRQIEQTGAEVHRVSRWLNAVSVTADSALLARINDLPFITRLTPVASYSRRHVIPDQPSEVQSAGKPFGATMLDYGSSLNQIRLCQIDSLHDMGYSGRDILIGIIDTGFKIYHPTFSDIIVENRLIGTYDFINDRETVWGDGFQDSHGTGVWSLIGGQSDGSLIGAAFDARFILGKTEIEAEEIEAEEDNWIAAAEWMESSGADIITSSLGYYDWYDFEDLDGNTAAITIAADIAASLGVLIVNSAGNERFGGWGHIITPADGDSVIAVGGVTPSGDLWLSSSPGPTADGRIKPDVAAQSSAVYSANYANDSFNFVSGTSYSAPLVAGGLALYLEAYPQKSVHDIIDALKATGTNSATPDNDYGWGIAQFFDMFAMDGYIASSTPEGPFDSGDTTYVEVTLYDSEGDSGGEHDIEITIDSQSSAELIGEPVVTDSTIRQDIFFPLPGVQTVIISDIVTGQHKTEQITVFGSIELSVIPSPAVDQINFMYDLDDPERVEITIYNVAAEKIIMLEDNNPVIGVNRLSWDPEGKLVSGIYIVYFESGEIREKLKFAYFNR